MNSWDSDPDERLRRHWQRTFADFEVQPRPSLSRRILGQLMAERRRKPGRWLAAGLLLLLSLSAVYWVRVENHTESKRGKSITVRQSTMNQPLSASRSRRATAPGGPVKPSGTATIPQPGEIIAERRLRVRPITTPELNPFRMRVSPQHQTTTGSIPSGKARLRSQTATTAQTTRLPINSSRSKPNRLPGTYLPKAVIHLAENTGNEPKPTSVNRISTDGYSLSSIPQPVVRQPVADAFPIVWTQLNPHAMVRFSTQLSALPSQLPAVSAEPQRPVRTAAARLHWRWFIDAIPLSSFQWMSVSPVSTAHLSDVSAPTAFSPATWGYQINGGLRFRHWQAYLSMGQLRRWAYYTVNENRFWVEPSATDPHRLMRDVHTVAENVLLPMVSAGLSQQRVLAQGRYAVEFGGQVSYLPTSDQALFGLRGSVGRRLLLNQRTELQVGLTTEYGLNRLVSDQKQLIIHPFVVGLGIRLQPRFQP